MTSFNPLRGPSKQLDQKRFWIALKLIKITCCSNTTITMINLIRQVCFSAVELLYFFFFFSSPTNRSFDYVVHKINLFPPFFLHFIVAWNDFDAIPRSASTLGLTNHGGSRKRLLFLRREVQRNEVTDKMQSQTSKKILFPAVCPNFRRVNMITDPAVENS